MENKQRDPIVSSVRSFTLNSGKRTLSIVMDDCHVGVTTSFYCHRNGNYTEITLYDVTSENLRELAARILAVALTPSN